MKRWEWTWVDGYDIDKIGTLVRNVLVSRLSQSIPFWRFMDAVEHLSKKLHKCVLRSTSKTGSIILEEITTTEPEIILECLNNQVEVTKRQNPRITISNFQKLTPFLDDARATAQALRWRSRDLELNSILPIKIDPDEVILAVPNPTPPPKCVVKRINEELKLIMEMSPNVKISYVPILQKEISDFYGALHSTSY